MLLLNVLVSGPLSKIVKLRRPFLVSRSPQNALYTKGIATRLKAQKSCHSRVRTYFIAGCRNPQGVIHGRDEPVAKA
jgi:hypothetical protein